MRISDLKLKHAWALGLLCVAYVVWAQPAALGPVILKMAQIWIGAVMGYWIDRALYDYAIPDDNDPDKDWMFRRVILVAACILGLTIG